MPTTVTALDRHVVRRNIAALDQAITDACLVRRFDRAYQLLCERRALEALEPEAA